MSRCIDAEVARLMSEGCTYAAIGAALGCTKAAIASRVARGRRARRKRFAVPAAHRHWYEKLRRNHSVAYARAELARVMDEGQAA